MLSCHTRILENLDLLESVTLEAAVADIEEDERGAYVLVPAGTTPYSLSVDHCQPCPVHHSSGRSTAD